MKRDECCTEFQKLSQILSGKEVLPDDWENIAVVLRESAKKVFGACSGREKEDKEIWFMFRLFYLHLFCRHESCILTCTLSIQTQHTTNKHSTKY